ncbi:MAG: hypothetical protein ACK55J_01545, partial [Alphaproteobacteria bacterium]
PYIHLNLILFGNLLICTQPGDARRVFMTNANDAMNAKRRRAVQSRIWPLTSRGVHMGSRNPLSSVVVEHLHTFR